MQAAADKGNEAESYSNEEASEIEHFPVHSFAPATRFRPLLGDKDGDPAGFSTSLRRSTNSGASRIAPSSTRHLRVSLCRAIKSNAWLISESPANSSAPFMSHRSRRSCLARRSL